jgi:DNA-binding beta-propeller fold protein YncE
MSSNSIARRRLLALIGAGVALTPVLVACGQSPPPAPSQAQPAAPTQAPMGAPQAPPAAPAQAPAAEAPQPKPVIGPTSALLKRLGVDKTSMGIKVAEERDASGPPAYEIKPGDLLAYTNASADYAATTKTDRVVIIDAKTRKIRHTQDVALSLQGKAAAGHMIGISPNAEFVYLPNRNEENLFVLDLRTLKTKQVLDLGTRAHHLNVFADRYMLGDAYKGNGVAGIFLLDPTEGNKGAGGIPRGDFGGEPYLAFPDPTDSFLYVTVDPRVRQLADGSEIVPAWISQIDLKTWGEIRTIPVGPNPIWAVFTRDGKYAYVTISVTNRVEKIDVAEGKAVAEAPTGRGPYGAVLSADEKSLYVVSKGEGGNGQRGATFVRIKTDTMRLDVEMPASPVQPNQPDHILLSPDGKELWISNNMGSITVFDEASLEQKAFIEMPDKGSAHGLTFVQFDQAGKGKVVMDLLGPHGGVSPYTYDQSIGRAVAYAAR